MQNTNNAFSEHTLEAGAITTKNSRFPRLVVSVEISAATAHNFWTGLARNLSEGGVFVATHNHMRLGSLVELHMEIDGGEAISTIAIVKSMLPYSSDDIAPGLMLQFVDLDAATLSRIRAFVAETRAPLFFDID